MLMQFTLTHASCAYIYFYSFSVTCTTAAEIDRLFEQFSQGGKVFLPLVASPVSVKFGWVADRYGVSWQLNLARNALAPGSQTKDEQLLLGRRLSFGKQRLKVAGRSKLE